MTGLTIGALISFFASRYFFRDYVRKKFINEIKILNKCDEHLCKNSFLTIFFLRNISLIPFELTNIVSGLSGIDFWKYFLGTLLGVIPGTIITIYFIKSTGNIFSLGFFIGTLLVGAFFLLPLLSKRVRKIIINLD